MRNRGIVVTSFPRQPPVTRASFSSGAGGKGKTKPRGRSVNQKKFVTRCFHCNFSGHLSGNPVLSRQGEGQDAQAHVTSCTLGETVHVHTKACVTSSISVAQEPRRAGS